VVITELETEQRGRPLLLGNQLDSLVQEFIRNLRVTGGVVNTTGVCRRDHNLSGRYKAFFTWWEH